MESGYLMSKFKKNNEKIVVTGGSGRFGSCLKKNTSNYKMLFPKKSELNILKVKSIKNLSQKVKAGDQLQGFLGRLFAIAESNPEIKSNSNYLHLQQELAAIEDKVAYSRQFYNDSVLGLENASERFPGVLFFKLFGRKKKDFLKIPETERKMPEIDL